MSEQKLIYSCDEVAKLLGISRGLTFKLCRQRRLPGVIFCGVRRMVVSKQSIDELLAGNGGKEIKGNGND